MFSFFGNHSTIQDNVSSSPNWNASVLLGAGATILVIFFLYYRVRQQEDIRMQESMRRERAIRNDSLRNVQDFYITLFRRHLIQELERIDPNRLLEYSQRNRC